MESEIVNERERMKIQLAREIADTESYMKQLETRGRNDPDNLEIALQVATVYADISSKYSSMAILESFEGKMTVQSSEAIRDATTFLDDAQSEIGDKIDLRNYTVEKNEALRRMRIPGLESKFAQLEVSFLKAKETRDMAVSSVKGLDTQLEFETVPLTDEQAYTLTATIENAAKIAATDDNYGCGFLSTGRKEVVEIRYRRKQEYIGLQKLKEERAEESLKEAIKNKDLIGEISSRIFLERIQKVIHTVEQYPDEVLIKVPEEEVERTEIEVGSDLDRQYWLFSDRLVRNSEMRRISPTLRREYDELRKQMFCSAPSLYLNHELYHKLKKEFPFLAHIDNPESFKELLNIATGKDGREKIYALLTGREVEGKISSRCVYAAQKLEGLLGLPSRGIETP